jgi:hypothetical protein
MEQRDKSLLRLAAEEIAESDKNAESELNFYLREGPAYLEKPHLEQDIGIDFPVKDRDQIDTTQPHGKLRSLMRTVIEGRNKS